MAHGVQSINAVTLLPHEQGTTDQHITGTDELHVCSSKASGGLPASLDVEAARLPDGTHAGSALVVQGADEPTEQECCDVSYNDIAKEFSLLGWTAFGGPSAHIGLFERVRYKPAD